MTDHISRNPVTPINKTFKRQFSTSTFSAKGKRKFDTISDVNNIDSSPFSASSNSSIFSPPHLSTLDYIEFNENVSPTPKNVLSNKKLKKSPREKGGVSSTNNTTTSRTVYNSAKKNSSHNNNNSASNILTPYKKTNSARKRRRSSIGLCITSSPTTPYGKTSPQNFSHLHSPTYSIRRRSITSSTKKNPFYSPRVKYSPKKLFTSPVKFKSICSPKASKYGYKKINDISLNEWNLNCSPVSQRIKRRVKAVVSIV